MPLAPIPLASLRKVGVGLKRPEDVVVARDGRGGRPRRGAPVAAGGGGAPGPPEPCGPVLGEPAFPRATPAQRATFGATDGCGFDRGGNLWVTLVLAHKIVAITPAR